MNQKVVFALLTVFCLSCALDSWVTVSEMPTARSDLSVVVAGDVVLAAGGCLLQTCPADLDSCSCLNVSTSLESYDPVAKTWTVLSDLPTQRFRHSAVVYNDLMVLFGGRDVTDTIIQTVDIYSISEDIWFTSPILWSEATSDNVGVIIGSIIYAIGGYDAIYDSLNSTCTLDLSNSTANWTCSQVAPLNEGRGDACGVVINGSIFVLGGFDQVNFCSALNSLEVYDLASNTWTVESRLHNARADPACAYLHGEFHAVGGEQKSQVEGCNKYDIPIRDVEHYEVSNNTWIEETPLPDARFRFSGVVIDNTILLFGGQGLVNQSTLVQPVLATVSAYEDSGDNSTTSTTSTTSTASAYDYRPIVATACILAIIF